MDQLSVKVTNCGIRQTRVYWVFLSGIGRADSFPARKDDPVMKTESYTTIEKLFIAAPALASRAKAAFDTINSGVELLKNALVEAERMEAEDFHNFIEIHISALGKKLHGSSGEQVDLPLD